LKIKKIFIIKKLKKINLSYLNNGNNNIIMLKDGLTNKQIQNIVRSEINAFKNSFSNKNGSYNMSEINTKHRVALNKCINKIVLN
jgi:hypothetical protein